MKKVVLLTALMCVTLTACSNKHNDNNTLTLNHTDNFKAIDISNDTVENEEHSDDSIYSDKIEHDYVFNEPTEEEQELVEYVTDGLNADDKADEYMYTYYINENTNIDIDILPDNLKSDVAFGYLSDVEACACYQASKELFGDNITMTTSDWLSSTMYDGYHTQIFQVNGTHYKYIIANDNSKIYIDSNI